MRELESSSSLMVIWGGGACKGGGPDKPAESVSRRWGSYSHNRTPGSASLCSLKAHCQATKRTNSTVTAPFFPQMF